MARLHKKEMADIKKYIDDHVDKITYVDEIINIFQIDRRILNDHFKLIYNICPKDYILEKKMERLIQLLKEIENDNIAFYYAHELGFDNSSAMFNMIKRKTGLTFLEFKKRVLNRQ